MYTEMRREQDKMPISHASAFVYDEYFNDFL